MKNKGRKRGVRLALAAGAFGLAAAAQGTILLDQHGDLTTSDPTYNRVGATSGDPDSACNGTSSDAHRYRTYTVNVAGTGPLNVHVSGIEGVVYLDTWVSVYSPSFDPNNPLTNCLRANDDAGIGFNSWSQIAAPAAGSYTIVVSSWAPGATGDYRVCATEGPDELNSCLEHARGIPALAPWGICALVGLLGLAAGWSFRRRRS